MAFNFSQTVYTPAFNLFARSVTVTPIVSQPGGAPYDNRGIFDTQETDVVGENGQVFSDAKTCLDILIKEYSIQPVQGDIIDIPDEADVQGGSFEVIDLEGVGNAGGQITLILRRIVPSRP